MAIKKLRINQFIRSDKVRLIDQAGEQLGSISTSEALLKAKGFNLDLVEVSPNASPPVCKILDYGKYIFERSKKPTKSPTQKKTRQQLKEVKFRPSIGSGDYDVKVRMIIRFLEGNDKVKVTIRFRGREMMHKHLGMTLLERVKTDIGELATVEQAPKMEGRQLMMVFAPVKSN
jgi:translation initiation factor IF-3